MRTASRAGENSCNYSFGGQCTKKSDFKTVPIWQVVLFGHCALLEQTHMCIGHKKEEF